MQNNSIAAPKKTKANCKPTTKPSKTDVFIEKARAKHGDRYGYVKVVYARLKEKVVITCREHGDFEQIADSHLRGSDCPTCNNEKLSKLYKKTTDQFTAEAKQKHGDRYDYSKVVYVRSRDKVIIICSEHGDFEQTPNGHLGGQGCPNCNGNMARAHTTKEWVLKAKEIHGDLYDYSKVVYIRKKYKVIIVCKEHGDFEQAPYHHLRGSGCAKCAISARKSSVEEWRFKARSIHGNRYDYSKARYASSHRKIIITCKEHGDFKQKPCDHLQGHGCAKCSSNHQYSTAEWVSEATAVHGDRFSYSEVKYASSKIKVAITCKEHGDFEQTPNSHLGGQGCPRCPRRHSEPTSIYIMANNYDQVKIGYSVEPERRLSELNRDAPFSAELLKTWVLPDAPAARAAEAAIHQELAGYHAGLSGFDGATEWFNTTFEYALGVIEWIVLEGESVDLEYYSEPVRDSTKMQQIALW